MRLFTLGALACFAAQAVSPSPFFTAAMFFVELIFMILNFSVPEIRRSSSPLRIVFLSILLLLFSAVPSLLHAQNANGTLRGEVQDASGARVAAARVVAESTGSSITREALTNERGEFRLEGLLPG